MLNKTGKNGCLVFFLILRGKHSVFIIMGDVNSGFFHRFSSSCWRSPLLFLVCWFYRVWLLYFAKTFFCIMWYLMFTWPSFFYWHGYYIVWFSNIKPNLHSWDKSIGHGIYSFFYVMWYSLLAFCSRFWSLWLPWDVFDSFEYQCQGSIDFRMI
jgi:hypothetical protein